MRLCMVRGVLYSRIDRLEVTADTCEHIKNDWGHDNRLHNFYSIEKSKTYQQVYKPFQSEETVEYVLRQ